MPFRVRKSIAGCAAMLFALTAIVMPTGAHHAVLRFNLEEMTAASDRIFVGTCVNVQETTEFIAQGELPITRYTFDVERALKGRLPRKLVYTQLGHAAQPIPRKNGEAISHGAPVGSSLMHGMSSINVGDRVTLFLIPNYLGGKVTYPVGLYQGAFFISRMPSGQELIRNSINNLGLFSSPYNGTAMKRSDAKVIFPESDQAPDELVHRRGALPLNDFVSMVERIIDSHGDQRGAIVGSQRGALQQ